MPFLYKETEINKNQPAYSVGLSKTILIVGLGNAGKRYNLTRHNLGFYCIDFVAATSHLESWINKKDLRVELTSGKMGDTRILAIKPTTFMNLSGEAIKGVMDFYKISNNQIIVIHDDIDLPFGQIRIKTKGSSAGHNGIKNVIGLIGDNFTRIRVGIGPKTPDQIDAQDFVLTKFSKGEQAHLTSIAKEVNSIINEHVFGGNLSDETRNVIN